MGETISGKWKTKSSNSNPDNRIEYNSKGITHNKGHSLILKPTINKKYNWYDSLCMKNYDTYLDEVETTGDARIIEDNCPCKTDQMAKKIDIDIEELN